jgi:DNA-binding response OmpR family regulator
MKILLVEDSTHLQRAIGRGLRKAGYAVDITGDGEEGLWLAEGNHYDVIILDLLLPGMDGLSLLRSLREGGNTVHVLILTAKITLEDKVLGFRVGADDYLTKPFDFEELLARVQALIRRGYATKNPTIQVGSLAIDTIRKTVTRKDRPIELRRTEYALLEYLAQRMGEPVSRTEIEEHIYDDRASHISNVVDAAICILRKKINIEGEPNLISTRRGLGYVLEHGSP